MNFGSRTRHRSTALAATLALGALGAVAAPPASAFKCTTTGQVGQTTLRAANGKFVSAELKYAKDDARYGMLRARPTTGQAGPWERFTYQCLGGDSVALKSSQTGMYVTAELGYGTTDPRYGMLRARATTISTWQRFSSVSLDNLTGVRVFRGANGLWVSSELGYPTTHERYGMLRARYDLAANGSKWGPWEKFTAP